MIDVLYINGIDGTKELKVGERLFAGQPVALDEQGRIVKATHNKKVYGIVMRDANEFANYAWGEVGAFGSGRLTIITDGIVRVKASEYGKIEILPSGPFSQHTIVKIFDDTKAYSPDQALYVDENGLITNAPTNKVSLFGRVLKPVDAMGWLEILVKAPIATSATELA